MFTWYARAMMAALAASGLALMSPPVVNAQPDPTPTSPTETPPPLPDLPDMPRPNNNNPQNVDLADKDCWVLNGVPTMWAPGLSTAPGQQAMPCYYVYGLQPH